MSETINPPEYYFTNVDFNPAFYANNLPTEEQALLDARYVKFPVAQNVPITFTATVRGLTATLLENSSIIATTQWVQNFFNYVKTIANTWSGLQTFTLGMLTDTINPTTPSGTLIIGNTAVNTNVEIATQTGRTSVLHLGDGSGSTTSGGIHIGNGLASTNNVNILYSATDAGSSGIINLGAVNATTNLRCPFTPAYSYPIASGKIGEFITGTNTSLAITANTPTSLSSINLPEGIWIIYGQIQGAGNSVFFTLAFSTTTNSITTGVIAIDSCPVAGTGPAQTLTYPVLVPAPVSPATTTTYYFVISIGTTQTLTNCVFLASRIA